MPFATDATWPQGLLIQFRASEADGIYENRWYGPYDTLLRHCFDYSFDYIVAAQALSTRDTRESVDFITYMIVTDEKRKPVLVLEIKNEGWRESPTRRRDADAQIRRRLDDLQAECPNPVLFGISAMGTYVRFYRLYRQTATIEPEEEALPQSKRVTPVSYLSGQWDCNMLEQEGFDAMKAIVAEIKSRGRGQ